MTFFNGSVVTEQLVTIDDERMRVVYTLTEGLPTCTFYGASAQILPEAGVDAASSGRSTYSPTSSNRVSQP